MIQRIVYRTLIELTNGKWSSVLLQRFATSKYSRLLVPSFAKIFKINQAEMEKPIQDYPTLHDFFIRKLKPGVRPGDDKQAETVLSPVDAVIEDIGQIEPEYRVTVKGKVYSIEEMLGGIEAADKYDKGTYMVLYLSPSHYHRIHSPVTGRVFSQRSLGSKSYPVNKMGLKYGKRTLAKNFRTITEVEHEFGRMAIVKVGAMFVNSIETTHEGDRLVKGSEMAYFTFGSTVVLLFEKDTFSLKRGLEVPVEITVGDVLGHFSTK